MRCEGPWGSSIVLAANPHQENVKDIDNFVWRMCEPFKFPIPRCDDAISIIIQDYSLYGLLV